MEWPVGAGEAGCGEDERGRRRQQWQEDTHHADNEREAAPDQEQGAHRG